MCVFKKNWKLDKGRWHPGGNFFSTSTHKFWFFACWMIDIKLRDSSKSVLNNEIWLQIIKISRSDSNSMPAFIKKKNWKLDLGVDPASRFLWKTMYLSSKESRTFINLFEIIGGQVIWFLCGPPLKSIWRYKCILALCLHFFKNHLLTMIPLCLL